VRAGNESPGFLAFCFGLPPTKRQKRARVANGRCDLQAIADDSGVGEQGRGLFVVVADDELRIKTIEGGPVTFPLFQDRGPTQSGLRAFEDEQFKKSSIPMFWNSPL
jgi:hypothetical protein